MSDHAATLRRIADDPHNSITSADKLLIEDAARELERMDSPLPRACVAIDRGEDPPAICPTCGATENDFCRLR